MTLLRSTWEVTTQADPRIDVTVQVFAASTGAFVIARHWEMALRYDGRSQQWIGTWPNEHQRRVLLAAAKHGLEALTKETA